MILSACSACSLLSYKGILSLFLKYRSRISCPTFKKKLILFPSSDIIYPYRLRLCEKLGDEYLMLGPLQTLYSVIMSMFGKKLYEKKQ
jgi:hypothetical protein